jgi:hypothetical protein
MVGNKGTRCMHEIVNSINREMHERQLSLAILGLLIWLSGFGFFTIRPLQVQQTYHT